MKKLIVLLFVLSSSYNSFSQKVDLDLDSLRFYMLELVNEFRTNLGVHELQADSFCNQAAQNHSVYMAKNNVCSHSEDSRKEGFTGRTHLDRGVYGENAQFYIFFKETPTKYIAKILFKRWEASPGHNAGMKRGQYFGFGIEVFAETEYAFSVAATQTFK
jgi:uncharacterized protein YkwD